MQRMRVLVVSTPIGMLGSGGGGGVEHTATMIVAGLSARGHALTVLSGQGSVLPPSCAGASLWLETGVNQPSWQQLPRDTPASIPADALLTRIWQRALERQADFDRILNLGYDHLPFWLTRFVTTPLCHLVSMGSVATVMDEVIEAVAAWGPDRLAFHTAAQAADFRLGAPPVLVGNGFDLSRYHPVAPDRVEAALGWAGRISPEKGLEDAARVAASLGLPLRVWGLRQDEAYAAAVERSVPTGTIEWRGFLPTDRLQAELGCCRVFLNTPRWNEAFGNVVVEAMACGVPVATYARGGPGELVREGVNGALATPDDLDSLEAAVRRAAGLDRGACRAWAEQHHSPEVFSARMEAWLQAVRPDPGPLS